MIEKSVLPTYREYPSLVNYRNKFLFNSGGYNPYFSKYHDSVDVYDIEKDEWSRAPKLN